MIQESYKNDRPTLFLIPTPIGNFDDITLRAIKVLEYVDYVLAEDTRETGKLLKHFNVDKKLISCYKFNENKITEKILNLLREGNNLGLTTDRGTPLISDPGKFIVKNVIEQGFNVVSLPGATAFVPALTVSGLDSDRFLFYGFLNSKENIRKKELNELRNLNYTIIFYESPHRIIKSLENMLDIFGNRKIIISREISKLNEEIFRGNISQAINYVENIKGEIVLVVEKNKNNDNIDYEILISEINKIVNEGKSTKDSINEISKKYNVSKNILYNKYINRGE